VVSVDDRQVAPGAAAPAPGAERTGQHAPGAALWLRWSLRDLRSRWVQVAAIALVIALGVGLDTGLSSSASWRRTSYDASYTVTGAHDLLVETAEGTSADRRSLLAAVGGIDHRRWIAGTTTALAVPVQVDASTATETILVPGRIVGVELAGSGAGVDTLAVTAGERLEPDDRGRVLLDEHFTLARDLPSTGTIRLGGGREVAYVGTALSPRYFLPGMETGGLFGAAGYAIAFAPLAWAQELGGEEGRVTEVGIVLAPGADARVVQAELEDALAGADGGAAVTVTRREEESSYRRLYDDIDSDQRMFTIFAGLILVGAAFAAFNLTGRIVEAQRREIGIGMAVGLPRHLLAVRPILVAVEVAVLGTLAGVAVGVAISRAIGGIVASFFPMPVWRTAIDLGVFVRGAALGVGLVVGASVWPVVRAVRVAPIDAIRTGPRRTAGSGLARFVRRVPLPGRSVAQMPLRNVLRAPRRSVLTGLGIAAMIATLVGVLGLLDSFHATIDRGEREIVGDAPERFTVTMQDFGLADGEQIDAVAATPGVAESSTGLRIGGTVAHGDDELDLLVDVIDMAEAPWTPTAIEGSLRTDEPSIVLAEKAAADLGVHAGDTVTFRHPRREGMGYRMVETQVLVGAIHPNPYRFIAYVDRAHAELFALDGIANTVEVRLERGADPTAVRRALFALPGVASVQSATESVTYVREALQELVDILQLVQGIVLLLALLIAFNSSSIGADERRREHATMFAFGVAPHRVLGVTVAESVLVGVGATALGIGAGLGLVGWLVHSLIPASLPDMLVTVAVAPRTYLTAAALGVLAVAVAPLLTFRRLRRLDIPTALRLVE
jgi:putative ABC transport system permease protein